MRYLFLFFLLIFSGNFFRRATFFLPLSTSDVLHLAIAVPGCYFRGRIWSMGHDFLPRVVPKPVDPVWHYLSLDQNNFRRRVFITNLFYHASSVLMYSGQIYDTPHLGVSCHHNLLIDRVVTSLYRRDKKLFSVVASNFDLLCAQPFRQYFL